MLSASLQLVSEMTCPSTFFLASYLPIFNKHFKRAPLTSRLMHGYVFALIITVSLKIRLWQASFGTCTSRSSAWWIADPTSIHAVVEATYFTTDWRVINGASSDPLDTILNHGEVWQQLHVPATKALWSKIRWKVARRTNTNLLDKLQTRDLGRQRHWRLIGAVLCQRHQGHLVRQRGLLSMHSLPRHHFYYLLYLLLRPTNNVGFQFLSE